MGSSKGTERTAEPLLLELTPATLGLPQNLEAEPLRLRGDLSLLKRHRIGLFCSIRCPGAAILRALEWTRRIPVGADGPVILSGFHSPIEQECLLALIRRQVPVIVCPAREIARYRWPEEWDEPLREGRLVLLSPFKAERRPTAATGERRNRLVLELSDDLVVIHAEPGGRIEGLLADGTAVGKKILEL